MILSKPQLVQNILNEISDNSTGQISPYDIRHNLLDVIDSVHLLLSEQNVNSLNFATPATRNTKAGELTLENLNLNNYTSTDNSALGYAALRASYQSARNTAIGSHSLSCNLYGDDNAAVGYNSLGGNTNGFGNIGLGNYTLVNNKVGNFNIAIGHGAGYYADRVTCNKLYIASHPVDSDYICDNPTGLGLIPLVYGDLELNQFGINVTNLDSSGTLQVGGDITPASTYLYNVGSENYLWNNIYTKSINFGSGLYISREDLNIITNSNIVPTGNQATLGTSGNSWNHGYFNNITVSGIATLNVFNAYEHYQYLSKTIYLASSGSVPLLTDDQMSGAGFVASTSGNGYTRNYSFIFESPSANTIACDNNGYARAAWLSNTSIALASNVYLKTNRITSYDSNCHGIYFDNGNTYFGRKNILDANPSSLNGSIAGLGNVNFIGNSGVISDYIATVGALESGVSVSTRLLTGTKKRIKDNANLNKDILNGFELKFIDTGLQNLSIPSDRLVIGSYNNSSYVFNAAVLMKNDSQGIFGINNLGQLSENIIPKTSLDIRTTGNAIIRSTAENQSNTIAALQLFGQQSCEYNGFEVAYLNMSGITDLSIFKDSGKQSFIRLYNNNSIGFFTSSGTTNAMLTIGDSFRNNAAISMKEHSGVLTSTPTYGKLYVKPKIVANQSHSIYFLDGLGNIHDLVVNPYDTNDGRALYTDSYGNTFGGLSCPQNRNISSQTVNNTAIGNSALKSINSGDFNVVFGAYSGSGISTGSRNIIIGTSSAQNIVNGQSNIVIGDNTFNRTSSGVSHNIIIGNSGIGSGINTNYNLLIGSNRNSILLHGILGPTNSDKHLYMPSGGKLSIYDNTNSDILSLRSNVIEVKDLAGNNYPDNTLSFKFTANQSADLLILKHDTVPLNKVASYDAESNNRPNAELKGDLKLLGAVRFSDNTSLESASQITNLTNNFSSISNNFNNLQNQFNSLVVEGTCSYRIAPPVNPGMPTSGNMIIRNNNWQDIGNVTLYNRDTTLNINAGDYVIAIKVNNEYRPLWVSNQDAPCFNCNN